MVDLMTTNGCAQHAQLPIEQQIVAVESSFNPYAIGVVGGRLQRQPRTKSEAVATAQALHANGWNFSMGCRQVNVKNLGLYGLTLETAFDPEKNSLAGAAIYNDCLSRATKKFGRGDSAVRAALSCYYSGNFTTGQRKEGNQPSYVDKVLANARSGQQSVSALAIPVIPSKSKNEQTNAAKALTPTNAPIEAGSKDGYLKPSAWDVFNEL